MNLAIEEIDCSLKEYLKSVREIHEEEMNVRWRDLGPFTFRSGKGRLAEITSSSPLGEVKMLQAILVQDHCAYILTGAVLREEFSRFQSELIAAMHSLTLKPDLFSAIQDAAKKSVLEKLFSSFGQILPEKRTSEWEKLQKIVLEEHASLGPCWHFFALKEGYSRIFPTTESVYTGQKPPCQ
ncbi:MAG: hypothetical protein HW387_75 [Parachlamydiales bacterium]|nr:hypothetical protein [Parachlamydiales bacterium]